MKPVFIFGSDPHSTAFLSALLAAHPQCVPTPQFSHAYLRASRHKLLGGGEAASGLGFYSRLHGGDLELPPQTDYPGFIGRLVAAYAADNGHPGADRWLEQVPLEQLPLLAATFPEARFLHLVRDGRALGVARGQAASGGGSVSQTGRTWRETVTRGLEAEAQLGPERCERLLYETLLDDLLPGLAALAPFIGVSPSEFRIPATVLHKDYSAHLYAWRTRLSAPMLRRFEAENGALLTRLGYGLEASGVLPARPDVWRRAGQQPTRPARKAALTRPVRPFEIPKQGQKDGLE